MSLLCTIISSVVLVIKKDTAHNAEECFVSNEFGGIIMICPNCKKETSSSLSTCEKCGIDLTFNKEMRSYVKRNCGYMLYFVIGLIGILVLVASISQNYDFENTTFLAAFIIS